MCAIHFVARLSAAVNGCQGLGFVDSLLVSTHEDLLHRVVRYSGVAESVVESIFFDLSYGGRDILHPDPALQPFIQVNPHTYVLMPGLWLSIAAERNLMVLFNRLPEEKKIYLGLVDSKETLMRSNMIASLTQTGFRCVDGKLPASLGLPDIDLAIISDLERACLILELKWFIGPAEVREVIEKSQELTKGVAQLQRISAEFDSGNKHLFQMLNIDESYEIGLAVVSANWIGHSDVQHPMVAIIQQHHIVSKLCQTQSLRQVLEWLRRKEYLPVRGVHFDIKTVTSTIAGWNLEWPSMRPLIDREFLPL